LGWWGKKEVLMQNKFNLGKFSFGIGDRFAHQAQAQLQAIIDAKKKGADITPVWNKSFREHQTIGSDPSETRYRADEAVQMLKWDGAYFADADHINLKTVDFFIDSCDFYTIDVADYIGKPAEPDSIQNFSKKYNKYAGSLVLPGLNQSIEISEDAIKNIAEKYLYAVQQAGEIYRHIKEKKAGKPFVAEVSMDETDEPQMPAEMFFILAALADEKIALSTIAPKFSGRFNKGVDYVGDLTQFEQEFEQDVAAVNLAVKEFGFDENLKLSVHSGSDKFSIYPIIKKIIRKHNAGLHIKTAGTTWLEELIGLAEAGGPGLAIAKEVYRKSLDNFDKLCAPYATVIDIDKSRLPTSDEVDQWDSIKYVSTLRHDQNNKNYNLHFRQLLHVGYKVAAEMGTVYLSALKENKKIIAKNVTQNIFERHISPLFIGD
jgi:hypothetical protein